MLNDSLKTLAATPPPKPFLTARSALAHVNELEAKLGLSKTKPPCNAFDLNRRIGKLEALIEQKNQANQPSPAATTAPPVASPPAPEKFGLARAAAAAKIFGAERPQNTIPDHIKGRARFEAALKISNS